MGSFRHIEVRKNGVVFVVDFCEHRILDDLVIEKVAQELYELAAKEDCTNLLLNFSSVGFLSSAMLGKLISLNKKMKAKRAKLKFCELRPEIMELFTLTGLNKLFDIKDDETNGLLAFY